MITMDDNECAGTIHRSLPSDDPDEIRPWLCAGPSDRDLATPTRRCITESGASMRKTSLMRTQRAGSCSRGRCSIRSRGGGSPHRGYPGALDGGLTTEGERYMRPSTGQRPHQGTSSCPSTRRSVGCACALTASLWCRVPSGSRVPRAHTLPATPLTETGA